MEKLSLGLEWFLNPDHVPLLVGLEKGWFRDAGLDLDLIEPKEHLDAVAEIEARRMDVAVTEPIHLVAERTRGMPVLGFARFLHTNGGVMYLRGRGIERPRDMAGARVQYPGAPGPGGIAIVRSMIEADGGGSGAKLKPVDNGFLHTDALAEDKADVATLVFYNFEIIEARHRGLDAALFALRDWGIPDFCQLVLITQPDAISRRRESLARLIGVLRRGIDFCYQHPSEARHIYDRRAGSDSSQGLAAAIFDATLPCFTYDLSMAPGYYARLEDWMLRTGQAERSVDPKSYWTNELAF